MDLVSNFVGSISPNMFGGNTQGITQNIDLGDNTFSDMLEKQINKEMEQQRTSFADSLGLPTGLNIADFDGSVPQFKLGMHAAGSKDNNFDAIKPVNDMENSNLNLDNKDVSTAELLTFFNSLFDSKPTMTDTSDSGLFNFERKVAANSYGRYSKNIVTDVSEFITDAFGRN